MAIHMLTFSRLGPWSYVRYLHHLIQTSYALPLPSMHPSSRLLSPRLSPHSAHLHDIPPLEVRFTFSHVNFLIDQFDAQLRFTATLMYH